MVRNIRRRRQRKPTNENAAQSSLVALRATKTDRAVQRLIAAEKARLRPSDDELDAQAEISDDDIEHAVTEWDIAQDQAGTGLDGLLDARAVESETA